MESFIVNIDPSKWFVRVPYISLPDMLKEGEYVEVPPGEDLLEHRVDHDVAARPPHAGTVHKNSFSCAMVFLS